MGGGNLKRADAEKLLTEVGWLSKQSAECQTAILRRGQMTVFEADESIFRIDDPPGGMFGIVEGAIGVLIPSRNCNSHEQLADILRQGTWFGYGPLVAGTRRTLGFKAIEPTVAIRVDLAAMKELGAKDAVFARCLGSLADQATVIAIGVIHDLLIPNMEMRIAATLLRVTGANCGSGSSSLPSVQLTQSDLAGLANASRHSVNRLLQRLEQLGWIEISYRCIQLRDPAALTRFAFNQDV